MANPIDWIKRETTIKNITTLDYLTVSKIETMLTTFETKINDPKTSPAVRKKLMKLHEKYTNQRGKTLNIYLQNKNKKKYKPALAGISKSYLSVVKLYQLMNKQTRDMSHLPNFIQKLQEHPIENSIGILGGALAISGLLGTTVGKATIAGHIKELLAKLIKDVLFKSWASGLLTIGGIALAGVIISKVIRKNKQMKAAEVYAAEQEANKGTAWDNDHLESANKDSLVGDAMSDPSVMKYLEEFSMNPYNHPDKIKLARQIVNEAKTKIAQNEQQIEDLRVENILESNTGIYDGLDIITKHGANKLKSVRLNSNVSIREALAEKSILELAKNKIVKKEFTTEHDKKPMNEIEKLENLDLTALETELKKYKDVDAYIASISIADDSKVKDEIKQYAKDVYNRAIVRVQMKDKDTTTIENNYNKALIAVGVKLGLVSEAELLNINGDDAKEASTATRIYTTHKKIIDKVMQNMQIENGKEMI